MAREALHRKFELQCPLPFGCDRYEMDFTTAESKQEYRALLKRAAVFEIVGADEEPSEGLDPATAHPRLARQSEAMKERLVAIDERLEQTRGLSHRALSHHAPEAAEIMMSEAFDWRMLTLSRPPTLPV